MQHSCRRRCRNWIWYVFVNLGNSAIATRYPIIVICLQQKRKKLGFSMTDMATVMKCLNWGIRTRQQRSGRARFCRLLCSGIPGLISWASYYRTLLTCHKAKFLSHTWEKCFFLPQSDNQLVCWPRIINYILFDGLYGGPVRL